MSSNGVFNSFSTTNPESSGIKGFLESNSLVSKFAFLLLVIIGFIFFLRVGIFVLPVVF